MIISPGNICASLATLSLFVLSSAAFCAENNAPAGFVIDKEAPLIQLGPVIVHPYLSVKESYSDNIYLSADNPKDDFITRIMPGIFLQMPISRHTLSLNADTTIDRYSRYTSEDKTDWSLKGSGDFNFGSLTNLKVSDYYKDGHESRSESSTAELESFRNNIAETSLTYNMANISKVQLDYTNTYWKYLDSSYRSRDENAVSAYIYYHILPKTSVFAEYEYKDISFEEKDRGLDSETNSAFIGFTWELSQRSKGTLKGGYLHKEFSRENLGTLDEFTASLDINHYFSDYNFVKLSGERTVNETSTRDSSYSLKTGIKGEFTHKFIDRLSAAVKGSYYEESFYDLVTDDERLRKDEVVQAGAEITYNFRRWLDFSLEYYWRHKYSTIDIYKSEENNAAITCKMFF